MNKSYQIWEAAKDAAEANPGKPSLVVCIAGTFTLTWTPKSELKGTDPTSRALPPSSPVADSPKCDPRNGCAQCNPDYPSAPSPSAGAAKETKP